VKNILCRTSLSLAIAALLPHAVPQQTVLHVEARLVEVSATIFDSHNRYIDGLTQDDFRVAENGQPQKLKYFESNTDSLSCAILLDTTGSMEKALPRLKNSVLRLIDQLGPNDSVAIYSFAEQLIPQQDFTKDKAAAKRAVLRLRAGGNTALYDALSETSQEVNRQPGKKAIVVFTDGEDNASVLTAQNAVNRARKNGFPLFTIVEGEATQSPQLKKMLSDLSKSSGGEAYEVKELKDMEEVFLRISSELRHIYLLSYRPTPEPTDGKWRKVEVSVNGSKDYRIRAKEGYFPN
jgi:Ca-activated chloride channel family protein